MNSHARNRIVAHRTVKAADLKPHPLNWRTHPEHQRAAVLALVDEVGLARSVVAYVADDDRSLGELAPLTLIDGHGRREWMPDESVTVEILDVNDEEARKLLLSLDPTAALAGRDDEALAQLREMATTDNATLEAFWAGLGDEPAPPEPEEREDDTPTPEQYLILVTCRNERHQADLLEKLKKQKLTCKPLIS